MIKTAILGASGMVGRKFSKLLIGHPDFEVISYTGFKTAGRRYEDVWYEREQKLNDAYGNVWTVEDIPEELERVVIDKTDAAEIAKRAELAFSALNNNSETEELEKKLASMGVKVFSNVGCMRLNPDIPLVIAEVNPESLSLVEKQEPYKNGGFIVKNANCTTIGLALALKPVHDLYRLKEVSVTTAQALSGKGDVSYEKGFMHGNIYPFIEGEEKKVEQETQKILNTYFDISAICTRANVRDGHMEYVRATTRKWPDLDELKEYMRNFNPLENYNLPTSPQHPIIVMNEDRPQPKLDVNNGNGMSVTVGRMDYDNIAALRFIVLSHNTIRGAAGASIQNAELYLRMFEKV